ncbi:D-alanine--D-alanine ligase [Cnuibacter physcomitrellae]|uniref:D-alanine--D-alanine ligase family protein n=1 Tax=Cnuibacter physcomitrellae TaxID=1619308 RepID=UPI002175E137|nr:D-alanine--D-alanine ligase [Cnuibacter physcomitrellae]MCS5497525.1 D-alanine--D-alanine ligase [Cnuibacter physcomitrellae]
MTSKTPRTVLVLAGGISHERDVSLRSGRRVAEALAARGHRVVVRDPDATLLPYLEESRPDVVWPALHGASGEDGALRALLAAQGVPYVGSTADASRLAWHKPVAKVLVSRAGFSTPLSLTLTRDSVRELGGAQVLSRVHSSFPGPIVVKPATGGSAQGVTSVHSEDELPRAIVDAFTYVETALVETKVAGTEVSVGILDLGEGPQPLPIVEIVPRSGVYSFEARYNAGETSFFTPARLDDSVAAAVSDAALRIHEVLGLRHISRVDFIVDEAGVPWFLEANVLPGLTETSIVPQALAAAGLELGEVYETLAEVAIRDAGEHPLD